MSRACLRDKEDKGAPDTFRMTSPTCNTWIGFFNPVLLFDPAQDPNPTVLNLKAQLTFRYITHVGAVVVFYTV
jgi:hypothetical protein